MEQKSLANYINNTYHHFDRIWLYRLTKLRTYQTEMIICSYNVNHSKLYFSYMQILETIGNQLWKTYMLMKPQNSLLYNTQNLIARKSNLLLFIPYNAPTYSLSIESIQA